MDLVLQYAIAILSGTLIALCWKAYSPHPLNQIPGPLLARLTSYYIILIDAAGNRSRHTHELHRTYGPVVRTGPNEVSFTAPSVAKELYSQGTPYMKAPWYEAMDTPPAGTFAMCNKKEHATRRRFLNPPFSQSAINDSEPVIAAYILKMLSILTAEKNKPVDMLQLCRRLSLDNVGQLFMDQSFHALESRNPPEFLEWIDNFFINLGIKFAFPPIHAIMKLIPLKGPQDMTSAASRISNYGEKTFDKYIQENGRHSKQRDLLSKILEANDSETSGRGDGSEKTTALSDRVIYIEVGKLIFAGTDTTGTTLTYLFWELAKNQGWQDKLRQELKSHVPDDVKVPKYVDVADLPILDAVVNETLRLHAVVPASLPRSTPAGGRTLDGYFIPEGTIVSTQNYTTHRDPLAFPNPETWDPNRWLTPPTDATQTARIKDLFMPFSRGLRACIGQRLATLEIKLTVAILVTDARMWVGDEMTKEDMEMIDHFLGVPRGGKCLVWVEGI